MGAEPTVRATAAPARMWSSLLGIPARHGSVQFRQARTNLWGILSARGGPPPPRGPTAIHTLALRRSASNDRYRAAGLPVAISDFSVSNAAPLPQSPERCPTDGQAMRRPAAATIFGVSKAVPIRVWCSGRGVSPALNPRTSDTALGEYWAKVGHETRTKLVPGASV